MYLRGAPRLRHTLRPMSLHGGRRHVALGHAPVGPTARRAGQATLADADARAGAGSCAQGVGGGGAESSEEHLAPRGTFAPRSGCKASRRENHRFRISSEPPHACEFPDVGGSGIQELWIFRDWEAQDTFSSKSAQGGGTISQRSGPSVPILTPTCPSAIPERQGSARNAVPMPIGEVDTCCKSACGPQCGTCSNVSAVAKRHGQHLAASSESSHFEIISAMGDLLGIRRVRQAAEKAEPDQGLSDAPFEDDGDGGHKRPKTNAQSCWGTLCRCPELAHEGVAIVGSR